MTRSVFVATVGLGLVAAMLGGCREQDRQIAHCKNVANVLVASEQSDIAYQIETTEPEQTDNRRKWVTVSQRQDSPSPVIVQVRCEYNAGQDVAQAAAIYVIGEKLDLQNLATANVSAIELMHR